MDLKFIYSSQNIFVHVVDNINYIGCDYGMCYFACVKG
jgi:hypothetical protein